MGEVAEGRRRAGAGLLELHGRRAPGRAAATVLGRRSSVRMELSRQSRADSNEENEQIRMKRKGHFSHFASDFMCFVFFNRLISL